MERYEIIKIIGSGSFSQVYLATDLETSEKVVLKKLNQISREEFEQESSLMRKCASEFTVRSLDSFEFDGHYYIVQEYANLGSLDAIVSSLKSQQKFFAEDEIWLIISQLLFGLQTIHNAGICHKDIKAQNVFIQSIDENFNASKALFKIGDFGIAVQLNKKQTKEQTQRPGTLAYMSPELLDNAPFSQKTDVWSMGILLYYICQFAFPFRRIDDIIQNNMPDFEHFAYSDALKAMAQKMLIFDQKLRPSVAELLQTQEVRRWADELLNEEEFAQFYAVAPASVFSRTLSYFTAGKTDRSMNSTRVSEMQQLWNTDFNRSFDKLKRIPAYDMPYFSAETRDSILHECDTVVADRRMVVGKTVAFTHNIRDYNQIKYFFSQDDICFREQPMAEVAIFAFGQAKVLVSGCGAGNISIYAPNIQFLSLSKNAVARLALKHCQSVKQLDLSHNELRSIDTRQLKALEVINMECNRLKAVNLLQNTNLRICYFQSNALTGVALPASIEKADFSYNEMQAIDVTRSSKLKVLNLNNNRIENVQFGKELQVLKLQNNRVEHLQIPAESDLRRLNVGNNDLSTLILDNAKELQQLSIFDNRLSELDLTSQNELAELYCYNNLFQELDLTANKKMLIFEANSCKLSSLSLFSSKEIVASYNQLSSIAITDKSCVLTMDLSHNEFESIALSEYDSVKNVFLSDNEIRELANLPESLAKLYINNNKLETLKVGKLDNIKYLDAADNLVQSCEIVDNKALRYCNLSNNEINSLSMHGNDEIETLVLNDINIKELDLSNLKCLKYLTMQEAGVSKLGLGNAIQLLYADITNSPVSSISFQRCISLQFLDISYSQLATLPNVQDLEQLRRFVAHNCKLASIHFEELEFIESVDIQYTQLKQAVFIKCGSLRQISVENNRIEQLAVENCEALVALNASNNLIITFLFDNIANLEVLDLNNNCLRSINIADYQRLQVINLSNNELETAELSNLSLAQTVNLQSNHLLSITVNNLPKAELLELQRNHLQEMEVDKCKASVINLSRNLFSKLPNLCTRELIIEDNPLQNIVFDNNYSYETLTIDCASINIKNELLKVLKANANRIQASDCRELEEIYSTDYCEIESPHGIKVVRIK